MASTFEEDAGAFIGGHGGFAFGWALVFAFADVGVAEGVGGEGVSAGAGADSDAELVGDGEGVGGDVAAVGVAEIDAALEMVGDDVGGEGDAVAVAVEDEGGAGAFFDHVARDDGAVGILDDDAVAEVVVDVVAGGTEVEGVGAVQGILIFFEVVGGDDDVVAIEEAESAILVVGEDVVGDARVFEAGEEVDAIAAVVVDGEAVEEKFLDELGAETIATFFVAADAEVSDLDAPELGFGIGGKGGVVWFEEEGGLAFGIGVEDMGGGSGTFDMGFGCFDEQRGVDSVETRGNAHDAAGRWQGVEGGLESGVVCRVNGDGR